MACVGVCDRTPSIESTVEALPRQVNLSGIRKSKITKGVGLGDLGGKGLRKRDGQIGPVTVFCCTSHINQLLIF